MNRWRALGRWIGDQIAGILLMLGWQPEEERDKKTPPP